MTKYYFILFISALFLFITSCDSCNQIKDGAYKNQDGFIYTIQNGIPSVFNQAWHCSKVNECGQNDWHCMDGVDPDEDVKLVADGNNIILTFTPPGTIETLTPVN